MKEKNRRKKGSWIFRTLLSIEIFDYDKTDLEKKNINGIYISIEAL
jgi:hypothetical protein